MGESKKAYEKQNIMRRGVESDMRSGSGTLRSTRTAQRPPQDEGALKLYRVRLFLTLKCSSTIFNVSKHGVPKDMNDGTHPFQAHTGMEPGSLHGHT